MKKLDILLIAIIVIFGSLFFVTYFQKTQIDTDNAQVEIYYKSIKLATEDYSEELNVIYHISSSDDLKQIHIERLDKNTGKTTKKIIEVTHTLAVKHTIELTYKEVRITEANCDGKDCMRGVINADNTAPIICILGINIRLANTEVEVIIGDN